MIKLLQKLDTLKEEKKILNEELKEGLMKFPDYAELHQEKKEVSEVLKQHKKNFLEITPTLGSIDKKIKDKNAEIKLIKQTLNDSISIVNKDTGETIQLSLF